MVDRSTDSSDAIVVFRVALSSLVGAALALMDSSTATCTVSVVVGGTVGTVVGFGVVVGIVGVVGVVGAFGAAAG